MPVAVLDQVQMLELGLLTGAYSVDSLYGNTGCEEFRWGVQN